MFIGDHAQKKVAAFLYSVGIAVVNRTPTTNQAKGNKGASMLPVCAYSTPGHALMGWYLIGYWLNEFPHVYATPERQGFF